MMKLKNTMLVALTMAASQAWAQTAMPADQAERCATRLSIAITGKSPTTALFSSATPQTETNNLINSADFQEPTLCPTRARFRSPCRSPSPPH